MQHAREIAATAMHMLIEGGIVTTAECQSHFPHLLDLDCSQPPFQQDHSALGKFIDHTVLQSQATAADIQKLCEEAVKYGFYCVCVQPCRIAEARAVLNTLNPGQELPHVASVVGFPQGANTTAVKVLEASKAIEDGATEIDMVINQGWLLENRYAAVRSEVQAVVSACGNVPVKVIIESSSISEEQICAVSILCVLAGAVFVKTSTGFGPHGGASIRAVELMRSTVGWSTNPVIGVKASGGIRSKEFALKLIEAGATRLGTSASVSLVQ